MIQEARIICEVFNNFTEEELAKWEYIFSVGYTQFFPIGFITYQVDDEVCYVNSATVGDVNFSRDMLLFIKQLADTYENILITTTNPDIKTMYKRGFVYNKDRCFYYRGKKLDTNNLIEFRRE